jgi:hypothetical protein
LARHPYLQLFRVKLLLSLSWYTVTRCLAFGNAVYALFLYFPFNFFLLVLGEINLGFKNILGHLEVNRYREKSMKLLDILFDKPGNKILRTLSPKCLALAL